MKKGCVLRGPLNPLVSRVILVSSVGVALSLHSFVSSIPFSSRESVGRRGPRLGWTRRTPQVSS